MKIYIGHSTAFDFKTELYEPLKKSAIAKNNVIYFPHEASLKPQSTKNIITECDLFVAEVSHPSTGLGIELGWANNAKCDIVCIHRAGSKPSSSLTIITNSIIKYEDLDDLINKLTGYMTNVIINKGRATARP